MAGRPRRTRIYGANYNIGESYYKPTLDTIDRKQLGNNEHSGLLGLDKLSSEIRQQNPGFKRALTEEPLFDYRIKATPLSSTSLMDGDLDEEVQTTLRKIREVKKANSYFLDESNPSFDDSNRKRGTGPGRFLKSLYDSDESDAFGMSATRFTKTVERGDNFESTSSASSRANATKERLANIESEMSERFDKQIQREKRSANLKKLLKETDVDTSKSVKKVTF